MGSALLHPSTTTNQQTASAMLVRTKMLASRTHPRSLGDYGAVVGSGRQDPELVADLRPPLSRIRGAVACRGRILRKATVALACKPSSKAFMNVGR